MQKVIIILSLLFLIGCSKDSIFLSKSELYVIIQKSCMFGYKKAILKGKFIDKGWVSCNSLATEVIYPEGNNE